VKFDKIRENTNGVSNYLVLNWYWGAKVWGANRIRYPSSPYSKRWIL